jgi:hypothetical protein
MTQKVGKLDSAAGQEIQPKKMKSFLGRFLVFSSVFALTPLLVLLHILTLFDLSGTSISISKLRFMALFILAASGSLLALMPIVYRLFKLRRLTKDLKQICREGSASSPVLDLAQEDGEVGEIAKYFGSILARVKQTDQELVEAKKTLHNPLSNLRKALTFSTNFETQIALVLEVLMEALQVKRGAILSRNNDQFRVVASVAEKGIAPAAISRALSSNLKKWANETELMLRPVVDGNEDKDIFGPPLIYAPFLSKGKPIGAICISGSGSRHNFSEDDIRTLSHISERFAVVFEHFEAGQDEQRTYFEALCVLTVAIELRDPFTIGHAERVALTCSRIGESLGLESQELKDLRNAALVHDIGNIGVSSAVLAKKGPLENGEWEIVAKHPAIGERILKPLTKYDQLLDPIRHHHEFLDGSGYPDGLKGTTISRLTRILTVANIFDALTSERPHRRPFSSQDALRMLKRMANEGKLDPQIVDALTQSDLPHREIEDAVAGVPYLGSLQQAAESGS